MSTHKPRRATPCVEQRCGELSALRSEDPGARRCAVDCLDRRHRKAAVARHGEQRRAWNLLDILPVAVPKGQIAGHRTKASRHEANAAIPSISTSCPRYPRTETPKSVLGGRCDARQSATTSQCGLQVRESRGGLGCMSYGFSDCRQRASRRPPGPPRLGALRPGPTGTARRETARNWPDPRRGGHRC